MFLNDATTAGPMCSCHKTVVKDRPDCIREMYGQHDDPQPVVGFLRRNYRQESLPIQIPQEAGWGHLMNWSKNLYPCALHPKLRVQSMIS